MKSLSMMEFFSLVCLLSLTGPSVWAPSAVTALFIFALAQFPGDLLLGSSPSPMSEMTALGWVLALLTVKITLFMLCVNLPLSPSSSALSQFLILSMMWVLLMVFLTKTLLQFFFYFELSLVPIFWMVTGTGAQPERLSAASSLLLYTAFASLPLLLVVILMSSETAPVTLLSGQAFIKSESSSLSQTWSLAILLAFLVKFPMFFFHAWLPKAHVEAPVSGSMVLAAILLKLGGFGIYLSLSLHPECLQVNWGIQAFALMGGFVVSILCLRQKDIKVMIAYSSVCHMGAVITATMMNNYWALKGALSLMVAHGVSSSLLFAMAYFPYLRAHSRNILILKGSLALSPFFTLLWFIACMGNMGGPLTLNLVSEVVTLSAIISMSSLSLAPLMLTAFFAVAYSLMLYVLVSQGQPDKKKLEMHFFTFNEKCVSSFHSLYTLALCWSLNWMLI